MLYIEMTLGAPHLNIKREVVFRFIYFTSSGKPGYTKGVRGSSSFRKVLLTV